MSIVFCDTSTVVKVDVLIITRVISVETIII
jgi:hypothetical protein